MRGSRRGAAPDIPAPCVVLHSYPLVGAAADAEHAIARSRRELVPTLVAGIFAAVPQIYEHKSSKRTILVLAVTAASTLLAGLVAYCKRSRSK